MAISQRYGRERSDFEDEEGARVKSYEVSRKLLERFEAEYGSGICGDIQTKLMGRSFDLMDPEERDEFLRRGGHEEHCPVVVGNAVKWTIEILLDEEEGSA
jgi:hypothetical protein